LTNEVKECKLLAH